MSSAVKLRHVPEQLDHGLLGLTRRRRVKAGAVHSRLGHRVRNWALARPRPQPLPSALGVLEGPYADRYGICCSGGGIRSAAFNLGALQALQADDERVLQRATYLAAVSGGSYMAAGFAMVAKVDGEEPSDPKLVDDSRPPFHPGSPEEQYLRNRSSYMAPGLGGKVRLVARVTVGVAINLLFLGALLFVLGWALAMLYGEVVHPGLRQLGGAADTSFETTVSASLLGAAMALAILAGLIRPWTEAPIRLLRAWGGRIGLLAVLVALVFVTLPELLEWLRKVPHDGSDGEVRGSRDVAATAGGTGALTLLGGALLQLRARLGEHRLLTQAAEAGRKGTGGFLAERVWPRLRPTIVMLATAAAGPLLLGGVLLASIILNLSIDAAEPIPLLAVALASVCFLALYLWGDVTTWSLHPFYKRRLCTAFALKRVEVDGEPRAVERDFDRLVPLSESGVEPVHDEAKRREWPMLIVCAAANVSDPGATPPGRAVTSFTFSPNAIGGPLVGGVATDEFERALEDRARDFTLPAAVAVSGAALSPSMGKMTRWPLRFLLTLANARLGVWIPNPRWMGEAAKPGNVRRRLSWRPRAQLLFNELLGRNSADARFLYVTDGGHYENLGLVELLRRGCRHVFCFDASGGRDVQELGDAIALARSELGVEIDVHPEKLLPDPRTGVAQASCATGAIRYPEGMTGTLVYVRCVLTAASPHDVQAYHEIDPAFPHNSTGDQLYTDQRFEAYRALGHCAGRDALAHFRPGSPGSPRSPLGEPGAGAAKRPASGGRVVLAEEFQRVVDSLPPDWTQLELDLRIADEERYIETATLLTQINAMPYSKHDWHWRLRVANQFGHAAAAPTVRGTLALLDSNGIVGELVAREARSGRVEVRHMWGRPESVRQEFARRRGQ